MIKLSGPLLSKIDRESHTYKKLSQANSRLAKKDHTLWGKDAEAEAAIRLNWIDLPESSRELLPTLDALAAKFRGREAILCGMGGSSLAPEVIANTFNKNLFVFDLTDPNYASHALNRDLKNSIIIVSSKSGSTIETASQRVAMEYALKSQGLDPREHIVFITDPGSPLDQETRAGGYLVVNADPNVGGRFSALTAFGLLPATLIGVDPALLLDSAAAQRLQLAKSENVAIDIAYLLYTESNQFVAFADSPNIPEQKQEIDMPLQHKLHIERLELSDKIEFLLNNSEFKVQILQILQERMKEFSSLRMERYMDEIYEKALAK